MSSKEKQLQQKEARKYFMEKGRTAFLYGLGASSIASIIAHKYSTTYNRLSVPFRLFLILAASTSCFIFKAERSLNDFVMKDYDKKVIEEASLSNQTYNYLKNHKGATIGLVWASSIAYFTHKFSKSKGLNFTQKFAEIRLPAQALTLITLGLAMFAFKESPKQKN